MKNLLKIVSVVVVLLAICGCDLKLGHDYTFTVNDDIAVVTQGQSVEIDVVANDTFRHEDNLHSTHIVLKSIVATPSKGTVVLNEANNTITYTANAGESGDDTFIYSAYATGTKDIYGGGTEDFNTTEKNATVTVHITEVENHKPTADDQTVELDCDVEGKPHVDIVLTGSDADGDPLTYILMQNPMIGAVSSIHNGNMITYTLYTKENLCNIDNNETDQFKFAVNDGLQDSDDANVTIIPINKLYY